MDSRNLFSGLEGLSVYCVGIKGTGMAAMAELLQKRGAAVSGSDSAEKFYTDTVLKELGIPYAEEFTKENLPGHTDVVIHSAAYSRDTNPELMEAERRGLPILTYPEALGLISSYSYSLGIAGTHGKTTTAGLCAALGSVSGLPLSVLVGSAVSNLGGRSTYVSGDKYFIAETCEYRRHFLQFHPSAAVITNVEPDHLDYFTGYDDVVRAFTQFAARLPEKGVLIYCADDRGAVETARRTAADRRDIRLVPYGRQAEGPYRVHSVRQGEGRLRFRLGEGKDEYAIRIPGDHNVLNAAAAAAVFTELYTKEADEAEGKQAASAHIAAVSAVRQGIEEYTGSSRRSEIIGEAGGIVFMDDYGHHPTEIKTTISGIKKFYPGRRLVVDFMSHTYSRTEALFADFSRAFSDADLVILHKIYASAREKENSGITGKTLFEEARKNTARAVYFHEVMEAGDYLLTNLRKGDVFLTMGAGDNWRLGRELYEKKKQERKI